MENIEHLLELSHLIFKKQKIKNNEIEALQKEIEKITVKMKRRPKMLVGKPGLDGHSNGAEQIAVRARDIGLEVVYDGIKINTRTISFCSN